MCIRDSIDTIFEVPDNRWVLWTQGPLRGPAVRFWGVLAVALLAAWALGRLTLSPLRTYEWVLIGIGLTQVPLPVAMIVVGWLFLLAWRGQPGFQQLRDRTYNLLQVLLIALTAISLGIFVAVVAAGLLGNPQMFIRGNGSTPDMLRWYQASNDGVLPRPLVISVSIWWYRFLMLLWALWLAASLIRWLRIGWTNFSSGGFFRRKPAAPVAPPPLRSASHQGHKGHEGEV